jgi:hypothetical protein
MTAPCVCGHDADEHQPAWGCVAQTYGNSGWPRPCMCAAYEADEVPF